MPPITWKREEEEFLIKNAGRMSSYEIAKVLGKTPSAVRSKLWRMRNAGKVRKIRIPKYLKEVMKLVDSGCKPYD